MSQAIEQGLREALVTAYTESVWGSTIKALDHMEITPVACPVPLEVAPPTLREGCFSLDSDKILYAVLATDPLLGYDPRDIYALWPFGALREYLERRVQEVREALTGKGLPTGNMLVIVLVGSYGRGAEVLLDLAPPGSEEPKEPDPLMLPTSDLEVIAGLESGNQLALWKFSTTLQQISQRCRLVSWSALDAFQWYLRHGHSFYFSDEAPPELIYIQPGGSGELRREALRRRDPHGVIWYDGRRVVEVTRFAEDQNEPIYLAPPTADLPVSFLVEGLPLPWWVVGPPMEEIPDPSELRQLLGVAGSVAYWLWQFTPALLRPLGALRSAYPVLCIELRLPPAQDWEYTAALDMQRATDDGLSAVTAAVDLASGRITLRVSQDLLELARASDNRADREPVRELLRALRSLNQAQKMPDPWSDQELDAILDVHAPPGAKKRLLYNTTDELPEIDPRGLPPLRAVQDADEAVVLNQLGEWLRGGGKWSVGPVRTEERCPLLNEAVSLLFNRMARRIARLSPEGLLEELVLHHEAIQRQGAIREHSAPTYMACYERDPARKAKVSQETFELGRSAVAIRFLIEYVVARPPQGDRPFSISAFDELLALSAQIMSLGFDSDLCRHGLADLKVSILPSGRLGVGRGKFQARYAAFTADLFDEQIDQVCLAYGKEGKEPSEDFTAAIESAARVEFGFSVAELTQFLGVLGSLSDDAGSGARCMRLSEVISAAAERLQWSKEQVSAAIEVFVLGPREDFLHPGQPHASTDVYPWRYNRGLSCVRRPLLRRWRGHIEELVWGPRALFACARYLYQLCISGRLKAQSPEMRQALGKVNTRRGQEFNDRVAQLLQQDARLLVRAQVEQIDTLPKENWPVGDIDVLVAHPDERRLLVMECKDLAFARTPSEIGLELGMLFGRDGQKSALSQALLRQQWADQHLSAVLRWLGADPAGEWRVEAWIVLDHVSLSPYLEDRGVTVATYDRLLQTLFDDQV